MLRQRAQGFTLVELMIVVAIIGILAALAVPNFVKFQARSKQAEAKASLRSYFSAEKHYFSEKDSYTDNLSALAFLPERGNRYSYRSMVVPTTWQVRTGANPTGADFNGIEVDCFKLGPGCTGRPVRSPGTAAFVTAYESTVTGPTDTGYIIGPNGGWILEAIGTIDNDAENDDWLVSSGTITVPPGPCSEDDRGVASVAVAVYNDVSCP